MYCLAVHRRLDPGSTFEDFCYKCKHPPYEQFPQEVEIARVAIVEETEANAQRTLPVFVPSFQVAENNAYGHEIYLKAAALTDSEILACTGKPPSSLGMSPWLCDWSSPQSSNSLYLVSLADLPENMKYTARRVKIYHSVQASRDKLQLTPNTMLSMTQHHSVFVNATGRYKECRPTGVITQTLSTIPELMELGKKVDSEIQQHLEAQGGGQVVDERKQHKVLGGLGEAVPVPKKATAKRKTPAVPGPGQSSSALVAAPAIVDDDLASVSGSSKKPRSQIQDDLLNQMDSEMRKVAQAHMFEGSNRNAKAKSLISLTINKFCSMTTDHNKGHALVNVYRH